MEKKVLVLEFKDSENKTGSIRIDSPKEDLTDEDVAAAMEGFVDSEVFTNKGLLFAKAHGAKIVTTSIKELDIA